MSGRRWAAGLAVLATAALLAFWAAGHLAPPAEPPTDLTPLSDPERRELRSLEKQAGTLEKKIRSLRPRGTYLIVDTGRNLMTVVENDRKTLTAVCSTGSGRALSDPERRRMWVFTTPRGEFVIRARYRNPVWIRPDWAFLEEGEPIPRSLADRMAPLELGAYAMDLGDGYLIHGTLYQRALGLSITHGCIRLGDRDLEKVFASVRIGTPVYIF